MGARSPSGRTDPAPEEVLARGLGLLAARERLATGTTPREVVWTRNKTTLYRYLPASPRRHRTPVLLVYALINRPYILDLRPGNSFVRHLLEHGHDVFLLDWGTPGWEDRGLTLTELIDEHLPRAATRVRRAAGTDSYTIIGYCMGGTMAAVHAALRPEGLRNLVALTTPIDFSAGGAHAPWTDRRHLDPERLAAALGNIPGALIELGNRMVRPVASALGAQAALWERLSAGRDTTDWMAIGKWAGDGVAFAGAAFVEWVRDFHQDNRLVRGSLTIGGAPVDLGRISAALLTIAGARDHIVTPAMARPLDRRTGSADHTYLELDAGHVGLLAGSGARTELWPAITGWLARRSD